MATNSTTKSKSRVIKLQDSETTRFLELYSGERVLYDPSIEEYKDRDLRMAAAKRISDELEIPGFGPREVLYKFKNLRSSYCQELKKIANSEWAAAAGTDDEVYRPKVFWFDQMHAFIRPFVQQRFTFSNLVLPANSNEELVVKSELDQSQSPYSQYDNLVDDINEIIQSTSQEAQQIKIESDIPRIAVKRKLPSNVSQSSSTKSKKAFQSDTEKLEDVSNHAAMINKEDSFDCFGKYVASLLRIIGPPTALRLQETITSLIINEIYPPRTPSRQSMQPSGAESNMSDYDD